MNRDALKKRGVQSVEDYFQQRGSLAHYLTGTWLRFLQAVPSHGNESRAKVLPLWTSVQAGFTAWAGLPADTQIKPIGPFEFNGKHLFSQMLGLVLRFAAEEGAELETDEQLTSYTASLMEKHLPGTWWQSKLKAKKEQLAFDKSAYTPAPAVPKKVAILKVKAPVKQNKKP